MTEAFLMAGITAAGFLLVLPLPKLPLAVRAALAFPVGLVTLLVIGVVLVASPASYRPVTSLIVLGVAAAAAALVTARREGRRELGRSLPWLAALTALAGLLSLGLQALDATALTLDSIRYLLIAATLAGTGGLDVAPRNELLTRGVVVPLMHAPADLVGREHLASVTPLLAVGGVALLVVLARLALTQIGTPPRWRNLLIVAAVVAILGSNRGLYHAFYVNGHLLFAVCLLILVSGYWMAATSGSVQWLLPALPALAVLVPLRPEAGLVVAPFLVAAVAHPNLPRLAKWLPAVPFAVASVGWFGLFLMPTRNTPFRLSEPEAGIVVVGVGVALVALLAAVRPRSWVVRIAPAFTVLAPVGLLITLFLGDSGARSIIRTSAVATATNLIADGGWGLTWLALLPALVIATVVARVPHQRLFTVPGAAFGALFLLLPNLRDAGAYRVGTGDSGNRMLMHVFLIALLYLVMAAGWGAAHEESWSSTATAPPMV